jgi:gluconokinase
VIVVLMGVSGSGKTTVGHLLARRLGCGFAEGDAFHPPANVAKMRSGTPLDDDDRWPWLAAIAVEIDARRKAGEDLVVTCSALKPAYRAVLTGGRADVRLVHLAGSFETIKARMEARRDHFMPPGLLTSQFAALQPPGPQEAALTLDIAAPPEILAQRIAQALGLDQAGSASPSEASAFSVGGNPA